MSLATGFTIGLTEIDARRDAEAVHAWLTDPHAAFWGMASLTVDEVGDYIAAVATHPHQDGWLGVVDGEPTFYAETYDPSRVLLPGVYDGAAGDLGMHVLIAAPGDRPRHGLTDAVFAAVMRWCFDDLDARRVVVEPDVRNAAIREKNRRAGFVEIGEVLVDDGGAVKTAMLSTCTREAFVRSDLGGVS
ncbi:hypothetical protein JOD63_002595 [Microbacterium terrae]|uniref:Lysine N-acyltransferase MbtK n=1 Tax=Microbacterium terrae TaxID=69369 RepID=A0A0M2HIN0_9MICO|nr:GNAT family N-acetyltransferase [Microbacterium terrae]KJL44642.1 Siderophore biosynthesis protein domain protein [Microbacterium terrae]MBP1078627.1 hypothetical protein [Microbacterium terrae]GLJ98028.1 acetyltransferase [Microbacterium terrae]